MYDMVIRRIKKLSDVIEALRLYQLKPLDCKPHCPYAEECENPDECICSSREEDALIYLEEFQSLSYCHAHKLNVQGEDILLCSECCYRIEPCVNYCTNCGRKIDWNWEHNE